VKQNRPVIIAFSLLLIFVVAGIWASNEYAAREQQRDIQGWGSRLSVIAESQKRAVESWLKAQTTNLQELAENPLLQILLSIREEPKSHTSEAERGQLAHLKNLITATARRSGAFSSPQQMNANQQTRLNEGVAITDSKGGLLLATQQFPAEDEHIHQAVQLAKKKGRAVVYGIYSNENQEPRLLLAVPVSAVQMNPGAKDYTGAVVAVINPQKNLYKILEQHWLTTETDETLLVTGDAFSTRFISPLSGKFKIFHTVSRQNKEQAVNFARDRIGDFALKHDYRGRQVLVTARNIADTNWVLVQKIDASEALRESHAHQKFILTIFTLAVFIIGVSFVAIWRHATSVRLQKTTESLTARTSLLNSVGNNISDHIFLLDKQNNILLGNASLSHALGVKVEDIKDKTLYHFFSADVAASLLDLRTQMDADGTNSRIMEIRIGEENYIYHVSATALQEGEYSGSALYVLHDITTIKRAQEKHNRLLEGIITTLVRAVDMHDPHCAHHSERTREVAVAVATAMGLDVERTRVLGTAAQLANLGKLNLPRELLTKMQPLSSEEQMQMHSSVLDTVNILKGLEFDGPVIDIISQKNEYLDGSGYPEGIKGDAILTESRILSVANAFVAMSSARAYRQGKSVPEVLDILLAQADKRYDRHVLAALFYVAENRTDWNSWQVVGDLQ
jgi:HD-GYP domain-containing protein (c-di-GMP phosphodiesterase class II)